MVSPIGFFLPAAGLLAALWPYKLAKFGERWDAIGSKRSSNSVEPADWNVVLARIIGISMSLVGTFALVVNS